MTRTRLERFQLNTVWGDLKGLRRPNLSLRGRDQGDTVGGSDAHVLVSLIGITLNGSVLAKRGPYRHDDTHEPKIGSSLQITLLNLTQNSIFGMVGANSTMRSVYGARNRLATSCDSCRRGNTRRAGGYSRADRRPFIFTGDC